MTADLRLQGAYTALVTPFSDDGALVDLDRLTDAIHLQAESGISGIVPCGTTGETPTLADEEYRTVVSTAIGIGHACGLTVIPGAGANSTARALELHQFCAGAGADAALQVAPYYNKPSQEGLYRHFMTLADGADLPIVLYNIPGRTGITISADTIEKLAHHPNIVAIKDATGGLEFAYAALARTSLAVLSGDDPLTLPMMSIGGAGVVSVVSNVIPDRVATMCGAFLEGDASRARRLNAHIVPLAQALLALDSNPVPVKAALAVLGRDSGAVRLPLTAASSAVQTQIRVLTEAIERETVGAPEMSTSAVDHGTLPYRIAVLCYLYDDAGRVLLLHRRKQPNAGMYSPIGGKLEVAQGEGPHDCALREIREETGITLPDETIRLTGMVSETAYQGETHWLIFLFEVLRPIGHDEIAHYDFDEGILEWIDAPRVLDLDIPRTDREVMWPLVQAHRGAGSFFVVHIDCRTDPMTWTVQESTRAERE